MLKLVNTNALPEVAWVSPSGNFASFDSNISVALGRNPDSLHLYERHPFDVEICRVPSGKAMCPYHSHSAQWEFYHVISGSGTVRHEAGVTEIVPGDAFIFQPGQPHQLIGGASGDLVLYIVADNPLGESCHYPDSNKWAVASPERRIVRSENLDYFDGEE